MTTITILFFGKLKDIWKTSQLDHQTDVRTIEEIYTELLKTAEQTPHKASIKVALNDEFVEWNTTINNGDTVAFLPPASGG